MGFSTATPQCLGSSRPYALLELHLHNQIAPIMHMLADHADSCHTCGAEQGLQKGAYCLHNVHCTALYMHCEDTKSHLDQADGGTQRQLVPVLQLQPAAAVPARKFAACQCRHSSLPCEAPALLGDAAPCMPQPLEPVQIPAKHIAPSHIVLWMVQDSYPRRCH